MKWDDKPLKKKRKTITYPWSYDEDVDTTMESLATAEALVGAKLSDKATKDGGMAMINYYGGSFFD